TLVLTVPSENRINELEQEVARQHTRALAATAVCLFVTVVALFGASVMSILGGWLLTTVGVIAVSRFGWLRGTSEAARRCKHEQETREYRLDDLRKLMTTIEEHHPESLHRLICRYGHELQDITSRHRSA